MLINLHLLIPLYKINSSGRKEPMKKHLLKFGLIGALLLLVPAQSRADMVELTAQNGSWNGFYATFIHKNATGGGSAIYGKLEGTLWGNLEEDNGIRTKLSSLGVPTALTFFAITLSGRFKVNF